ncbi:MAG: alpha/beta hydrolase fold domain-containing protein [Proteiniphilum sp.]|jgi:acetyl esterase/lipase/lysophospholipase L1-like esterase|nr:alpha/beta hydrolase fold domain-containing protein [Proteiniphilum sp.]
MKRFTFFFLILSVALTALTAQETHIIFIGNSITQGVILEEPHTTSPPAQTMAWLAAESDLPFSYSNCGVSGRTTVNFLPAKAAEFSKVVEAADAAQAKGARLLFSVMLGTNDSAIKGPLGAPVHPEQYQTNMKTIADALLERYPGAMILLHRPIWYSPNTHNNSTYLREGLERLNSYLPVLKRLEEEYMVTHPAQLFLGDTLAYNHFREKSELYFAEEGQAGTFSLHPNETGAKELGVFWGKAIRDRLTREPLFTEYPLNTVKEKPLVDEDPKKGLLAPSLRVYLPEAGKATGRMVIALPGGGYRNLMVFYEGFDWADYFLSKGIAFGVLKYRMPEGDHSLPLADVQAAFNLVKEHASVWKVNPQEIGIMGSSAGGHLASTFATHAPVVERPAFQILLYPVITMDPALTHPGSRRNLLGENPSQELTDRFSNELRVDGDTPPAFIIFAADDKIVPPANGLHFAEAMVRHKRPVTFLLYPSGDHGFGNYDTFPYKKQFFLELDRWLEGL